jgi:hypothetical protein
MSSQRICERRTFCADADVEIEVSAARMNCSLACLHRWKTDGSPHTLSLTRGNNVVDLEAKAPKPRQSQCQLWVISGYSIRRLRCPLCPKSGHQLARAAYLERACFLNDRDGLIFSSRIMEAAGVTRSRFISPAWRR